MDAPSRTPQGGLRVPASLTRSGVFVYHRADGTEVREFRSEAEVFKADSLASLPGAPVTLRHPSKPVRADNYREFAKGHVGDAVVRNGERVGATLYVQDGELVSAIERGDMREVSCGYTCDVVDEAGEHNGERYDRAQKNISYNHVAIVPVGRAGSSVRLHLDAQDNIITVDTDDPHRESNMTKERIDGVDYEVGTEPHKAAVARRDATEKAAKDAADKLQARADAAEAEAKKLKEDAAALPGKLAEQAKARAALELSARKVLGAEAKFDGLKDAEVRAQVVAKATPEIKLDGKSDVYVEALFDSAITRADANEGSDELAAIRAVRDTERIDATGETRVDVDAAYEAMVKRERNRWKNLDKAKA
jgi:hypothetical protein